MFKVHRSTMFFAALKFSRNTF